MFWTISSSRDIIVLDLMKVSDIIDNYFTFYCQVYEYYYLSDISVCLEAHSMPHRGVPSSIIACLTRECLQASGVNGLSSAKRPLLTSADGIIVSCRSFSPSSQIPYRRQRQLLISASPTLTHVPRNQNASVDHCQDSFCVILNDMKKH